MAGIYSIGLCRPEHSYGNYDSFRFWPVAISLLTKFDFHSKSIEVCVKIRDILINYSLLVSSD